MKRIYWRPQGMPVIAFVLITLFSVGGLILVEQFQFSIKRAPFYHEKMAASKLAMEAMGVIRQERSIRKDAVESETDPAGSGLIGQALTPVTSDIGDLESKQTSANPNFAAVFVELLKEAKVRDGDTVAVSMTGSFPALNICLYSAITTLHLKPVVISSVASSQWGANNPSFLWIDMESVLEKKGLFSFRSSAASMGGRNDMAREMTAEGREMIVAGIRRNGLKMIVARNIPADIDERMKIYFDTPQAFPRAYINIGGGVASVGTRISRVLLKPGKLSELSSDIKAETVVYRFLTEKIPVIHVENIKEIAKQYGLPILPGSTPQAGEGQVYHGRQYNRWLAGSILAGILFGLYIFGRVDWGFRMLRASSHQETGPPEPMV